MTKADIVFKEYIRKIMEEGGLVRASVPNTRMAELPTPSTLLEPLWNLISQRRISYHHPSSHRYKVSHQRDALDLSRSV